jgi:hypothetical protein
VRGPASPLSYRGMARDAQADQVNSWAAELDESRATIRRLEREAAQHRAESALPRPAPLGVSDLRRSRYGHLPLLPRVEPLDLRMRTSVDERLKVPPFPREDRWKGKFHDHAALHAFQRRALH